MHLPHTFNLRVHLCIKGGGKKKKASGKHLLSRQRQKFYILADVLLQEQSLKCCLCCVCGAQVTLACSVLDDAELYSSTRVFARFCTNHHYASMTQQWK